MASIVNNFKEQVKGLLTKENALRALSFGLEVAVSSVLTPAAGLALAAGLGVATEVGAKKIREHNSPHPSDEDKESEIEQKMAEKYPHIKKVIDEQVDNELGIGVQHELGS